MFDIKLLRDTTYKPHKAFDGDAGFDVFYDGTEPIKLYPKEHVKIPLGFAIELPAGYVALIQAKSGLAGNFGLTTIGNVIDSTYRGECHAILLNTSDKLVIIDSGDKIAQMLVIPCYTKCEYTIVDKLSFTVRGEGGFGSTGK